MKNILLTGSLRSSPLVAPATKGGMHFQRPQGGCMVFRRAKARLSGFRRQRRHLYWRPQGRRTSPAQRYYITPEGESPQPACKAKPITGRTLGAQGQRPGGAINPRPRKTTVGRLNGRPFYGQAKGQLRPTCTSYAGCAHQPSGIQESTAPVPTAPKAPEPSRPTGRVHFISSACDV